MAITNGLAAGIDTAATGGALPSQGIMVGVLARVSTSYIRAAAVELIKCDAKLVDAADDILR